MDIVIHSLGMPFDGNTIKERSLGGSETAAYYQALELAKLGHRVQVFTGCKQMMDADGVRYVPCGELSQEHPLGQDLHSFPTRRSSD